MNFNKIFFAFQCANGKRKGLLRIQKSLDEQVAPHGTTTHHFCTSSSGFYGARPSASVLRSSNTTGSPSFPDQYNPPRTNPPLALALRSKKELSPSALY